MKPYQNIQQHPASVDAYIRHGWSLVPIPPNTKGPRTQGWNLKEKALTDQSALPQGYGIGLAHAYSGTMALDVDDWDRAEQELQKHGISLPAFYDDPEAVIIHSGRPGHGKLLYAMPFGLALRSKKLADTGPDGHLRNYLDFRCATANELTVQDVLPPSIHPDTGQPYQWAGRGNWTRLPVIPQPLLDMWLALIEQDSTRTIADGGTIPTSWNEITTALEHIPADCDREEWVQVGMALHWTGAQSGQIDQALQIWHEWSATAQHKYKGDREILQQWASFRDDKSSTVKLGTLFHTAKLYGWQRPLPDATELFSPAVVPESPTTLSLSLRPPAPDMALELWPAILRIRAQEISSSVGCDPLVPLLAGLAAACGVVDARIRLELMPGYRVPPVLWIMTIGEPADKKSPGSRPMFRTLRDLEAEDRPRFAKDLLAWEGHEAAYASSKKAFLEYAASPEALLGGQAPHVPDMPPQPVPMKITVSDVTSQKLVRQAADRPRGLLCYLDEMNAWVRKLTDNRSGEDRSAWVVSYESERYEMDRVGAGSIHADNLAVSIYGNIQPQVFRQNLANLASDGLIQRFIPAVLRGDYTKRGEPVPEHETHAAEWDATLRFLFAIPEQTYTLSPEAFQAYRDFQTWYEAAKRDERVANAGHEYMTAFGKIEGTTGRLILMFHLIESPFSPTVSVDVVIRVIDLVRGYVIPSLRYAFGEIAGAAVDSFEQWLIDHMIYTAGHATTVTLSTLKRSARRKLEGLTPWQADATVTNSMYSLEAAQWVTPIDTHMPRGNITWAINPSLATIYADHRESVIRAKQRHADYIYRLVIPTHGRKLIKGYDPETMDD